MWQKISVFPLVAYAAFVGLVRDLKNDERGLSGVVVTVLLILVAVLAVVVLWGLLSGYITDMWEQITQKSTELQ